jgi:hypothetical protein
MAPEARRRNSWGDSESKNTLKSWLERVDDRFMGSPIDVHPHEALLHALRVTAGEVAYCDEQIRKLQEDELFERPAETYYAQMPSGAWQLIEEKRDAEVISRWVQLRDGSLDRMAKYSKMALDVGIEERTVQLAERQAELVTRFFESVLDELELTPEQYEKLGPAMRKNLVLTQGAT